MLLAVASNALANWLSTIWLMLTAQNSFCFFFSCSTFYVVKNFMHLSRCFWCSFRCLQPAGWMVKPKLNVGCIQLKEEKERWNFMSWSRNKYTRAHNKQIIIEEMKMSIDVTFCLVLLPSSTQRHFGKKEKNWIKLGNVSAFIMISAAEQHQQRIKKKKLWCALCVQIFRMSFLLLDGRHIHWDHIERDREGEREIQREKEREAYTDNK